jgi:hypothetical protein
LYSAYVIELALYSRYAACLFEIASNKFFVKCAAGRPSAVMYPPRLCFVP